MGKIDGFHLRLGLSMVYIKLLELFACRKKAKERNISKICLYYRISDHGYDKVKAPYITKENSLANAVARFPLSHVEWKVLADNVCDETYSMILKYVPESRVQRVSVGHGAGTFRHVYEDALKQPVNTLIYFLEDDYLHCPHSMELLMEIARSGIADYFTLYDHPDKYQWNSPNPFVSCGGEKTKVFYSGNRHWKLTNSTTMTFAAFVDTLKRDKKYFWRWTSTRHPYDFQIFLELKFIGRRKLVSPIPSLSTHGDTHSLALGVEWEKQVL